ncbi:SEC23-interacting protein [Seminavis robusta]|uniref:SEC23-interacting protein n=1 Tax=Seminavis robusta TaxID=568900 RepID=A0A9N8HYE2_9STRA|nr:SEC23-interacting protein [Seminavis robusta]|eukprot:Sro1979_g309080.1 SEC23-interacting protein (1316) ;mRNA; r:8116-12244
MGDNEGQMLSTPRAKKRSSHDQRRQTRLGHQSPIIVQSPQIHHPSPYHQLSTSDSDFVMAEPDDNVSPFEAPQRYNQSDYFGNGPLGASSTLRHVRHISKRVGLASKKVIWDSNDNAIDAAQIAVDQWEESYNALRGLLLATTNNAVKLYGAAKAGATGLEHGILVPVRDWILLPAFDAAEKTVGFLQSEQAHQAASQSLQLVQQVPWVGPTVLAPSMVLWVQVVQTSWQVALYPVPSRHQVRNSVDFVLTGTKWALSTAAREILFYIKRADAIITRTLSHTQWKVLGSGPYATLDKLNKQEVIDHLCERYFSLRGTITRYELAAHVREHNLPLYRDLVLTGILRERGGSLTKDDEWLSTCPSYRKNSKEAFLLPNYHVADTADADLGSDLTDAGSALWFRLPYINGKRPSRDTPWVRFNGDDRAKLERRYLDIVQDGTSTRSSHLNPSPEKSESLEETGLEHPASSREVSKNDNDVKDYSSCQSQDYGGDNAEMGMGVSSGYPTVAQWYVPDLERDVMVDQKRHSVSYYMCCPRCRKRHESFSLEQDVRSKPPSFGDVCRSCADSEAALAMLSSPPLSMVMRPNLWRFHGPGDEVRRAVWFLDTRRHGLQPFGEEAQAVLEDAYLFLKWRRECLKEGLAEGRDDTTLQPVRESTCPEDADAPERKVEQEGHLDENALLTVQVESPDGGEQQLVQFSSLTAATAIKKGLGGAISLFKRRVYRGADLSHPKIPESVFGVTPEAVFSGDFSLKSQHQPEADNNEQNDENEDDEDWAVLPVASSKKSLAVPSTQFDDVDRDPQRQSDDDTDRTDDIDHLVLMVHGIGEMLRSVDLFGLQITNLSTIVDCAGFLRQNHAEVQSARFSHMYPTHESVPTVSTGRVEYLPIEWHEAFSIMSQRMSAPSQFEASPIGRQLVKAGGRQSRVMMQDISLRTIPQMRTFANDTLMDVLFFMSAEHHDTIIQICTAEMNVVVQKFKALTGFRGKVSIIGHSLGSIISWDILAHQFPSKVMDSFMSGDEPHGDSIPVGGKSDVRSHNAEEWEDVSTSCPESPEDSNFESAELQVPNSSEHKGLEVSNVRTYDSFVRDPSSSWQYPKLQFDVDNAFMLGSPIAVFLMVRNQRKPLSADYSLGGCSRVFNIFHPYDPVAYRIEPLIDPRNSEFEPRIMTHWNGGFRVQYQTKRLWRKLIQTTMQTQQTVIERLEEGIAGMGLLDAVGDLNDEDNQPVRGTPDDDQATNHVATGKLNEGRRIDYMLQEKEIEAANEYVAAFAAHSAYWQEKDLSLFIARQIYLSRLAREQALHFEDLLPFHDAISSPHAK